MYAQVGELLDIARSLTVTPPKSVPPSSKTWKFPDCPKSAQLNEYTSFHVSVTVNCGVFSIPEPVNVATV